MRCVGSRVLRHVAANELRLLGAFRRTLMRRPIPSAEVTFMRESTYGGVALALGVVVALDAIPVHFILHGHPLLQAVMLAIHVYAIMWLVGDVRILREATCTFERSALVVDLGARGSARVPFHTVSAVSRVEPARPMAARDELWLTPNDPPNVLLRLAKPIVVRGRLGIRRRARNLRIYVDDPARFIALLESRHTLGGSTDT